MGYYRAPIKSGVHRFAVLSLFRALFRGTRLANVPQDAQPMLRAAVRQRFRKNRETQKPSELEAALLVGFRTLSILRSAPENGPSRVDKLVSTITRVCPPPASAYFRKRPPSKQERRELAEQGLSSEPVTWQREGAVRVLTDRPLPLEKLRGSGIRQVPRIATTTGMAFLRLGKPQSPFLSRMLREKIRKHQRNVDRIRWLEQLERDAEREDEWDDLLEERLAVPREDEKGEGAGAGAGAGEKKSRWANVPSEELAAQREGHEEFWRRIQRINKRVWEVYAAERELAAKEARDRAMVEEKAEEVAEKEETTNEGEKEKESPEMKDQIGLQAA